MTEFGASSSSSSSSCSSPFTYRWPYHVFLSFRGEDTRYGFTGNLYYALRERGIRTFIDDQGIRKGEEITPTLLKTIKESKTAIVVFSEDYASSTFCLTELVQILDCMKEHNGRFIWPVFYDVDPSNVRHQKGTYKDAFDRHEGVKDETTVKRWSFALKEVANLSGWHVESKSGSKSYEYENIEEIIEAVSKEISIGLLHIAQFPVGLESQVEEVCSLLNKQPHCKGATIVGIFGLGGIGKTTIARSLYNEIASYFKHKCFLNNIKGKPIHDLQKRLLSETVRGTYIELKDYRAGIPIIKDMLCSKKILLILDDIDTLEQLWALAGEPNWFGFGSIIIITTRDKNLLEKHEVKRIYEVKELDDGEARKLLILNAFKTEEVDPKYKEVINRALKYAKGLPLALEILGSNLGTSHSIKEWETALDIYEKIPEKTIQKVLKVSYDGLEETQRDIFLDIACFYKALPSKYSTEMLSASHGVGSEFCIRVLIDKSLIKINEYGQFDMHDLIQDMGMEIVRMESTLEAGGRSRLWSFEDISHVLQGNTGTSKIQAIKLWSPSSWSTEKVEWSGEAFKEMKNLRELSFYHLRSSQGPKCLPNSLRVLEWHDYPSSTLPNSRLETLGKPFQKISFTAFFMALAFTAHWIELLYVGQISKSNKMFVVELAQILVKVQPPAPVSPKLVNQNKQDELQQTGNTNFILPGKEIPKWFHKHSIGSSVSFWVHKKFPQLALCAVLTGSPFTEGSVSFVLRINDTLEYVFGNEILPQNETDYILLFDLRSHDMNFNMIRNYLEKELNHVEFSWEGPGVMESGYQFVKCFGIYFYNYDICMEDILFENPIPQKRIPVEGVHKICESNSESSSVYYDNSRDCRASNEEDDKSKNEIVALSTEVVSTIEKEEKKWMLDVVDSSSFSTSLGYSSDNSSTLEEQGTINDRGDDEMGSRKTRVTCFDLFSCLVSLCSSSTAP